MATEKIEKPVVSLLKIALLFASPTNPRNTFDETSLNELAESMKQQGILSPLLVRPVKDKYEVVCGERRYRAAKLATFREVPCYIRKELTDEQVIEMQITENLHREDVHPLEEMESYQLLLKKHGLTTAQLALKLSKEEAYIIQRLQLAVLSEPARKYFRERIIGWAHARLLARLQDADQKAALEHIVNVSGKDIWAEPPHELRAWITNHTMLDLGDVKWITADESEPLDAKAGKCSACPKRSSVNKSLFADIQKGDFCFDPTCFQKKQTAFVKIQIAGAANGDKPALQVSTNYQPQNSGPAGTIGTAKYTKLRNAKECDFSRKSVIVESATRADIGQVIHVCLKSSECPTHGEKAQPVKRDSSGLTKDEVKTQRVETRTRQRAVLAIEKKVTKLDRDLLNLVATAFIQRLGNQTAQTIVVLKGWKPEKKKDEYLRYDDVLAKKIPTLSDKELAGFLTLAALTTWQGEAQYTALAKQYDVDVKAIRKEVESDLAPKAKKAAAAK